MQESVSYAVIVWHTFSTHSTGTSFVQNQDAVDQLGSGHIALPPQPVFAVMLMKRALFMKGRKPLSPVRRSHISFAMSHVIHGTNRWCDCRCDQKIATRFVNNSYRICDVDRRRFASAHLPRTFVNRAPDLSTSCQNINQNHSARLLY